MTRRQVNYAMTLVADLRAIKRERDRPDGIIQVRAECWNRLSASAKA